VSEGSLRYARHTASAVYCSAARKGCGSSHTSGLVPRHAARTFSSSSSHSGVIAVLTIEAKRQLFHHVRSLGFVWGSFRFVLGSFLLRFDDSKALLRFAFRVDGHHGGVPRHAVSAAVRLICLGYR
jgi:hypothetical protein